MAASATVVLVASLQKSLGLFLLGFVLLFILSGIGNGSTYKMIPSVFGRPLGATGQRPSQPEAARIATAVIGIAGAVGAAGGVLVNLGFRQSFLSFHNGNSAYIGFIAAYALCLTVTWVGYLRPAQFGAWAVACEFGTRRRAGSSKRRHAGTQALTRTARTAPCNAR